MRSASTFFIYSTVKLPCKILEPLVASFAKLKKVQ